MAKKKKGMIEIGMAPMEFKPPSTRQVIKSESRYMADRIIQSHPKVRKMKDEIASAVEKAACKHLGNGKAKSSKV
jgi:hypothetical protein